MAYVRRMEQSPAVGQRDKYQLLLEKTYSVTCTTKVLAFKFWEGVRKKKSGPNLKQTNKKTFDSNQLTFRTKSGCLCFNFGVVEILIWLKPELK